MTAFIFLTILFLCCSLSLWLGQRQAIQTSKKTLELSCAHVWEKWKEVSHINGGGNWGQKRQCEICGYTEWEKRKG